MLVPALFALVFGFLAFRSRIRGVYFSIITQALALSAWLVFNRNEMNLGGTNGLADFKTVFGFPLNQPSTQRRLYVITALALVGAWALCRWITRSRAGKVLVAIRDSETRVLFSGYSPASYKLFVFVVSAVLAGVAGALYAPQVGIITPAKIGVLPSIEMVVWVAAGGRGTLIGAVLGAIGVNWIQRWLTTSYPDLWLIFLGALFMGVVLFFPDGVVGALRRLAACCAGCGRRRGTRRPRDQFNQSVRRRQPARSSNRPPTSRAASPTRYNDDAIIYLEDVTVYYDGFKALTRLNFYMDRRELRVVIGPNGAGKTTLLDVISGRVKPEHGRVIFGRNTDLTVLSENEIAALGIGRKFQTPSVFVNLTVWENVELSLRRPSKGVLATLMRRDGSEARDRIAATLDTVGLGAKARGVGRRALARREAVAGDRHGHGPGPRAAAGRRAGGRPDRRGDGAHGRAAAVDRRRALGARHRARHGVRAPDRPHGHGAPPGLGALRGRRSSRSSATRACSRSISGTGQCEPRRRRGDEVSL